MKKHLILLSTFAAWMLSATLLTACGEDVQELADNGDNGETVIETTTGENCTLFSTGDDGTRTYMDAGREFYWSDGDQIYVNTEGTTYMRTTSSTRRENNKMADFVLSGVQLTHSPCSLMYIGNGTTAATADASALKVKIEATQRQTAWSNSDHLGASGDCGFAMATRDDATGKYSFTLTHKASYLVFQPYRAANVTDNWKLLKIEIITNGTTKVAGEYDFGTGELAGTGTAGTVAINCNSTINANGVGTGGFELPDSASWVGGDKRSCFAIIAPGNHKLTIRYTIQPTGSMNDVAGATFTIDKEIPAVNADGTRPYRANGVTTIKHKLGAMVFDNVNFYQWDAVNPYGSSTGTDYNPIGPPTTASEIDARRATNSCKDMPNANELYWYVVNGDPHWDTTTWWSIDGGRNMYTNGAWFKTKATIQAEGKTFRDDIGHDGVDMRLTYKYHNVTPSQAVLPVTDRSKYFFLPALGYYHPTVSRVDWRTDGVYWSSSPWPNGATGAGSMLFSSSHVNVNYGNYRYYSFAVAPQWFK